MVLILFILEHLGEITSDAPWHTVVRVLVSRLNTLDISEYRDQVINTNLIHIGHGLFTEHKVMVLWCSGF